MIDNGIAVVNYKMNQEEIKKTQIEILLWLKNKCEEYDINFFLAWGTLLGAVRHNGYIPWDDDIDVGMIRKEYNKFCHIMKNENGRYRFFCAENNSKYLYPIGKLIDTYTTLREDKVDCGVSLGVYIDIFPYDYCASDSNSQAIRYKKYLQYERLLDFAMSREHGAKTWIKKVSVKMIDMILRITGKQWITKKIISYAQSENNTYNDYMASTSYVFKPGRLVQSKSIENTVKGIFEGGVFPIPSGYDEYLSAMYGDYMLLPPVEQRKASHYYEAYYQGARE